MKAPVKPKTPPAPAKKGPTMDQQMAAAKAITAAKKKAKSAKAAASAKKKGKPLTPR